MIDKILQELDDEFGDLITEYNELEELWSNAKTDKEEIEDRQKQTLAVLEDNAPDAKTNVERTRFAYKNNHYEGWIKEAKAKRLEFYKLDHRKRGLERRMDHNRSKMSYIKNVTNYAK